MIGATLSHSCIVEKIGTFTVALIRPPLQKMATFFSWHRWSC